jgi:hypothetical protein
MGNENSTYSALKCFNMYIQNITITSLSFQKLESLLIDKAINKSGSFHINKCEFFSLCHKFFMDDTSNNPYQKIHKHFFIGLYNHCLQHENDKTSNIYLIMFYLIPLLNNDTKQKVKAFYICFKNFLGGSISGEQLKVLFTNYLTWNLRIAMYSVIEHIKSEKEREDMKKLYNTVLTEENITRLNKSTIYIIAGNEKDLDKKSIVIDDIFLIAKKNEFLFSLWDLLLEMWNRYKPLVEG